MTYEQYYEYIDFILASSGVGLALCLTAYAINYIRTLVVVRRVRVRVRVRVRARAS